MTAIICSQDTIASAALVQCQQLGYRVPEDVSIVGFDDLPIAAYTSPPLTTIRQDRTELGKSGFFALSSLLNHVSISTFLLHAQLIERKSTARISEKQYTLARCSRKRTVCFDGIIFIANCSFYFRILFYLQFCFLE